MKGEENSTMLFRPSILFHRGNMEEMMKARNSPHSLLSKKGKRKSLLKPSPTKVREMIILNKSFLFCLWAVVTFPSLWSSGKHRGHPSWKQAIGVPAWSPSLSWDCHVLCQWTRAGCHRGDSGARAAEISHLLSLIAVSRWHAFFRLRASLVSPYDAFLHIKWISVHAGCRGLYRKREEEAKRCSKKFHGGSTHPVANHRGLYPCRWCQQSKVGANDHLYHLSDTHATAGITVTSWTSLIRLLSEFH